MTMDAKAKLKNVDNAELALLVFDRLVRRHGDRFSDLVYVTLQDLFDELIPQGRVVRRGEYDD